MTAPQRLSIATESPFQFQDHSIRMQLDGERLWFAARDVCAALAIKWNGSVLSSIPREWQGMRKFLTPSGNQQLRAIIEPAVYKLAFRSNKPEADAFTNWIASEVVPSIRKRGKYEIQGHAPHPLTEDMDLPESASEAAPSEVDELFEDSLGAAGDMLDDVERYRDARATPGDDADKILDALHELGLSLYCFVRAVDAMRAAPRHGAAAVPPEALRLPAGKRLGCLRMAVRLCQSAGAPDRVEEFYGRLCAQLAGGAEEAAGAGLSLPSLEGRLREFIGERVAAAPGARLPSRRFYEAFCRWLEERGALSPTLTIKRVTRTVRLARLLPIAHSAPSVVFGEVSLRSASGPAPLPLFR